MKLFRISLVSMMMRYYLMMAIIVIAGFSGIWLLSLLALPVFFSALMGLQFKNTTMTTRRRKSGRVALHTSIRQVPAHA